MRRLWAAVRLAVLGAVLGAAIGLGVSLGASALYRWGEGQSATPAAERWPRALSLAVSDDDCGQGCGRDRDQPGNRRRVVASAPGACPLDACRATARGRT